MSQILEVLQGPPACGKTTYAKAKASMDPSYVRVCRDDLRNMRGIYWLPKQEELITDWERNCMFDALRKGYNVILDATNLNPKFLDLLVEAVRRYNEAPLTGTVQIQYKIFTDVTIEECIKRDAIRASKGERAVGEKVIRDFAKKYLTHDSKYASIVQNPALPHAIIVDIDGTVALCGDRSHYDYSKVQFDTEHTVITDIVRPYVYGKDAEAIYVSGREDSCKEETIQWLVKRQLFIEGVTQIHMRKSGDHRKDCIIKKELFDTHIKDKYYIRFCIDDRTQVVQLWRSLGLICLQVADGNF